MLTLPYISHTTKIRELMQAGIVPDWMYRDCDVHGMDTAEDFLCEWDWEWGWDLGYGYTDSQLAILKKARQIVKEGIEEFECNPELQKIEREKVNRIKKKKELIAVLQKKFCPPFYVAEIPNIVNYVLVHNEEPVFSIFYCWFVRHRHSERNKIRFVMAGIYDGIPRTPKEIEEMTKTGELKEKFGITTEFSFRQLQRFAKTPYQIKGKLDYLIPAIRIKLCELLKSEDSTPALSNGNHSIWQEISNRENVRFNPTLLSRSLAYFLK